MVRKGELSKPAIDSGWPFQVVIPANDVRGAGYASRYDFANTMSLCPRGHSIRRDDTDYVVLCFSERTDAERFMKRFGGEFIEPRDRRAWRAKK